MTAASSLITAPGARIAFVLEIEGHGVAYTDVPDLTSWTGYTVRPGLQMRGAVSRSIDLLGFQMSPVGFQFEIVDPIPWDTTNSLAKLLAHLDATALATELTVALDRDDTTVQVKSTAAWPASGTLYIGHERITYAAKSASPAQFTGCTRGQFPTSADSAASPGTWSHTHRVGTEAGPEVASKIRVWRNRMVTIYAVAADPTTGTWNTRAQSLNELVGTIEDYGFKSGSWQFSCVTLEKRIEAPLLATQYQGYYTGFVLGSAATLRATLQLSSGSFTTANLTIPAGQYTLASLIGKINDVSRGIFTNYNIGFAIAGDVVKFTVLASTAGVYQVNVEATNQAGQLVLRMLGWNDYHPRVSHYAAASDSFSQFSPNPPIVTLWSATQNNLTATQAAGEWVVQSSDDLPRSGAEGYLQVGDADYVWLVSEASNVFTYIMAYDFHGRPLGGNDVSNLEIIRHLGEDQQVPVKQVWIVTGSAIRMLLRMLLSTGTANYNHATYDKWPASMSAGFPANLVDIPSIEAMAEQVGAATKGTQVLLKPEAMATHVESLMCQFGFHLVWRNVGGTYKLSAVCPQTIEHQTPSYTLDDTNTGNDHESETASGAEFVRNRLTLKYNRDPSSGEFLAADVYENLSAISEQDEPSALEYEALMLYDLDGTKTRAWRANVAAPMCAYFARPIRKFTRSGARPLWFLSVGDVVLLNDPDMPDAVAGTYGTFAKAWVTAVTKNYETYELESIELLVPPGKAYRYAPSAMLDYNRGDKGYDSATKRLFCLDNEFTVAGAAKDVTYFQAGDTVLIHPVGDLGSTSGLTWTRQLAAVGSNYLEMTATLSAPAFGTTQRYYVTLANYSQVIATNSNRNRDAGGTSPVTFLADFNTNVLADGGSGVAPFQWGADIPTTVAGAAPTGDEHARQVADTVPLSNALSVHLLRDLVFGVNNAYRHVTNQHPISEQYPTARTTSSTTFVQLAGPFKVFCPPGVEQLVFSIDMLVSAGTGTVQATCSTRRPRGASTTVLEFDNDVDQASVTTTSTSITKVAITVNVRPNQEGYSYVTLEFKNTAGTNTVRAISAYFAARAVA